MYFKDHLELKRVLKILLRFSASPYAVDSSGKGGIKLEHILEGGGGGGGGGSINSKSKTTGLLTNDSNTSV